MKFLKRFSRHAADFGAHRLRIADTIGIARPSTVRYMIKKMKKTVPGLLIDFHGHNDMGMATANAVTAFEAGADALSVTVNGLGERAGNAPLEQVAVALGHFSPSACDIHTSHLLPLCSYVSKSSKRKISVDNPVTGADIFRHESGIHCAGLIKNPMAYQPFPPESIGRAKESYVVGRHSGSKIIRYLLAEKGVAVSREQATVLKEYIRDFAVKNKMVFTPDSLEVFIKSLLDQKKTIFAA